MQFVNSRKKHCRRLQLPPCGPALLLLLLSAPPAPLLLGSSSCRFSSLPYPHLTFLHHPLSPSPLWLSRGCPSDPPNPAVGPSCDIQSTALQHQRTRLQSQRLARPAACSSVCAKQVAEQEACEGPGGTWALRAEGQTGLQPPAWPRPGAAGARLSGTLHNTRRDNEMLGRAHRHANRICHPGQGSETRT